MKPLKVLGGMIVAGAAATAALAAYAHKEAPKPLHIEAGKPIPLGKLEARIQGRLGEEDFYPFGKFVDEHAPQLAVRITRGDRIPFHHADGSDSHFVTSKKPTLLGKDELEDLVEQETGVQDPNVAYGAMHGVEVVAQSPIAFTPPSERTLTGRLKAGFKKLQERYFPSKEPKFDFFSKPRGIIRVQDNGDYPYDFSPVTEYINYEFSFLQDFERDRIHNFFDNISNEVSLRLLKRTGKKSIDDAVEQLKGDLEGKGIIMKEIARAFRVADVIYGEENLFSDGLNPATNAGDFFHLDCDLLVHGFLHVGRNLGLPLYEVPSPGHLYLEWDDGEEKFAVEATEFQAQEERNGWIHKKTGKLGKKFFIDYEHHRSQWTISRRLQRNARYFEKHTGADVRLAIKSTAINGVYSRADRHRDPTLKERVVAEMKRLSRKSRNPFIHQNLYSHYRSTAFGDFARKDHRSSLENITQAIRILERSGDKVSKSRPTEDYDLRARIHLKRGRKAAAMRDFRRVIRSYKKGKDAPKSARQLVDYGIMDEGIARAHFHVGMQAYRRGNHSTAYNSNLIYTVNYLMNNETSDKTLNRAFLIAAKIFRTQDPGLSREMRQRARERGL